MITMASTVRSSLLPLFAIFGGVQGSFCSDPSNQYKVCNYGLGCFCFSDGACTELPYAPPGTDLALVPCVENLRGEPLDFGQCTMDSAENDSCSPREEDVDAGCSVAGVKGSCGSDVIAIDDKYPVCITYGTSRSENSEPCLIGDGCGCFRGVCLDDLFSSPTSAGYSYCVASCATDDDCPTAGEICCPEKKVCEPELVDNPGACGDPHMQGFRGQKFDFLGEDGGWYSVLDDGPALRMNMRVTSPVPDVPEITYITGLSIMTTDVEGVDHTIVVQVTDPYSLEASCPGGVSPCLAEGALSVHVDGEEVLEAPGTKTLGTNVAISAVNLPGECRSFGFEEYWERKKLEHAQAGRRLRVVGELQDMSDWILGDPTATNMEECEEYVATAGMAHELGLFAHDSEHTSFQILTPLGTVRLSHGRLHQIAMRDPTDKFDLPDHLTWQMNLAIDDSQVSLNAKGILGETLVPTRDHSGRPIMQGMECIRGSQEDYRVGGPIEIVFAQGSHHPQ